jgi:hypothetical protein
MCHDSYLPSSPATLQALDRMEYVVVKATASPDVRIVGPHFNASSMKAVFQGKVKRKKKAHETARTEDEVENDAPEDEVEGGGRACRQKGWWKRGDVEAKLNTVNMTAWVHRECDVIEEEAITKLQEAWDSSEQKDECIVQLNDLEGAYWMGTEIGQLGGYGFQGVTLGVD